MLPVAVPSTGAGVGGGHQGDGGWERRFQASAAQPNRSFLQGLAQLIQHGPGEFRQFVKEQHAAVGQAQLPRPWMTAAPQQGRR